MCKREKVYFCFRSCWAGKHFVMCLSEVFPLLRRNLFTNAVGDLFPARKTLKTCNLSAEGFHTLWVDVVDGPWQISFLHSFVSVSSMTSSLKFYSFTAYKHLLLMQLLLGKAIYHLSDILMRNLSTEHTGTYSTSNTFVENASSC